MIDYDTTKRPTKPSEWQALVEAIVKASPEDESDWVEWKSTIDWSNKDHLGGLVSRAILSFANRVDPPPAPQLDGAGFIVIGLEPGSVNGIQRIDPAPLEEKLRPYLGEAGPAFEVRWHEIDGKDVMSIEVPNPPPGSPIYALNKEVGKYLNGTVFVRGKGKTGTATAAQIAALTRRANLIEADEIEVDLVPPPKFAVPKVLIDAHSTAIYVKWLRDRFLQPMEERPRGSDPFRFSPERRSPQEFTAEVDSYIGDVRGEIDGAVRDFAAGLVPPLRLRISNKTARNYPGMRITLTFDGSIVGREVDDAIDRIDAYFPSPPDRWGANFLAGLTTPFYPSAVIPRTDSGIVIENGDQLVVRLAEFDLRAFEQDTTIVRDLVLLVPLGHQGPVHATWTATCSDINGMARGEFWIPLSEPAIDPVRRAMEMAPDA